MNKIDLSDTKCNAQIRIGEKTITLNDVVINA